MWERNDKIHIVLFMFAQHPNCLGIRIVIEYVVNRCAVVAIHLTRHTKMAAPEVVLLSLLKRIHCVCLCDRHQELSKGWSRYKKSWSVRGKMQRVVDCNTNSAQKTWKNNIRGWDRDGWNIERNKKTFVPEKAKRSKRLLFVTLWGKFCCVLLQGFNRASEGEAVSGETASAGGEQAQPRASAGQDASQCPAGTGWQGKCTSSQNLKNDNNKSLFNVHVQAKI